VARPQVIPFGGLLRQFRKGRNLTQQALGVSVGISSNYVAQLEKGRRSRPSADLLARISNVLALSEQDRQSLYRAAGSAPSAGDAASDATTPSFPPQPIDRQALIARTYWSLAPGERSAPRAAEVLWREHQINIASRVVETNVVGWEQQGWVEHRVWESPADELPSRDVNLEQQLLRCYPIRYAQVARLPRPAGAGLEDDNRTHAWLGRMAAAVLLALVREGDRVAVGSGRSTYECANAVRDRDWGYFPQLDAIMSLTGRMAVGPWGASPRGPRQDADDVAASLLAVLPWHRALLVQQPLGTVKGGKLPDHLQPWDTKEGRSYLPHIAIVGIGVLAGGHRLCSEDVYTDLASDIHEPLRRLRETAARVDALAENSTPRYHCVADVCNHLFPVEPPGPKDEELWPELLKAIADFNKREVSARPEQLALVAKHGAVIAVAGGWYKARAIRQLLVETRQPIVTHLLTDEATARWLVQAAGAHASGRGGKLPEARPANGPAPP
jgi:transcriptional regulator with XRE-family HTH domain